MSESEQITDKTSAISESADCATAPAPPAQDASPEEKDRYWRAHCFQVETESHLTARALLVGGLLGMFMSISNLYTTLQLGWSFGVAITACVLSFVLWNGFRALSGNRLRPMSLLENTYMQSAASAAGYSTGSTLGTAFAALLMLTGDHQRWMVVTPFVFFTATLGVLLAVPMKRQMINYEQLKFPSGIAAAETLRSLYSHGAEALQKAYALLAALVIGGLVGLLRTYGGLLEQLRRTGRPLAWLEKIQALIRLPETVPLPAWLSPLARGHMTGYSFEPSVLLIGAGMLVGLRVGLSMLAGSLLLYVLVVPWLLSIDAANAGVAGYVPSFRLSLEGNFNPVRWGLWGGTAVMVFSSLTSVALEWRTFARAFSIFKSGRRHTTQDVLADLEVPTTWLVIGLIPVSIGLVTVQCLAFHISVFLGIIAVAFSFVVALVCCRATGETDTTPIGPMGKVTQLLYAALPGARGSASINLMAAAATAAAGASAADLLTVQKTGYLLGAHPRRQFLAMLFGVMCGTLAVVPGWYLMVPNRAALDRFNLPSANMWKAVADLLTQGVHMLPRTAIVGIVIGAFVGLALPVLERLLPKARPYLPSAMGLGLSWVLTFDNNLSFALGAAAVALWTRWDRARCDRFSVPLASGFIAGESLVAALIAIGCTVAGLLAVR